MAFDLWNSYNCLSTSCLKLEHIRAVVELRAQGFQHAPIVLVVCRDDARALRHPAAVLSFVGLTLGFDVLQLDLASFELRHLLLEDVDAFVRVGQLKRERGAELGDVDAVVTLLPPIGDVHGARGVFKYA